MTDARPHDPLPAAAKLACLLPFLSASLAGGIGLLLGGAWDEAGFAATVVGFGTALGLAGAVSAQRPGRPVTAWPVAAGMAAFLMVSCYAYGRLMGHATAEIRGGLAVVMMALALAAVASSALSLARVRRAVAKDGGGVRR